MSCAVGSPLISWRVTGLRMMTPLVKPTAKAYLQTCYHPCSGRHPRPSPGIREFYRSRRHSLLPVVHSPEKKYRCSTRDHREAYAKAGSYRLAERRREVDCESQDHLSNLHLRRMSSYQTSVRIHRKRGSVGIDTMGYAHAMHER